MIETISNDIEVYTLKDKTDIGPAADAFLCGRITLMKVGSVFSIVYNPNIAGLTEKICVLKGRQNKQFMSVVCTYNQAKRIVDENRVNEDFYRLSPDFSSRAIVRIPVKRNTTLPFPYNEEEGTLQFLDFEKAHSLRNAFREELVSRGCAIIPITSGNIHGASTVEDLESAKRLAALFNMKAAFLDMDTVQTIVVDIPQDKGDHKGSFMIISFCNPYAIEVKRLANKTDRETTERHIAQLLENTIMKTPLLYAL